MKIYEIVPGLFHRDLITAKNPDYSKGGEDCHDRNQ